MKIKLFSLILISVCCLMATKLVADSSSKTMQNHLQKIDTARLINHLPSTLFQQISRGSTVIKNSNESGVYPTGLILKTHNHIPSAEKLYQTNPLRQLPESVDMESLFPPAGNQGAQGSCAAWAMGYYLKSMFEAREHGWDITSADHQFSPAFLYNQVQFYDEGTSMDDMLEILMNQGCATLSQAPYDDQDNLSWPPAEAFKSAIPYRIESFDYLGHGQTPFLFDSVQQLLAQQEGIVFGLPIFRKSPGEAGRFDQLSAYDYGYDMPDREDIYLSGYHAMTLCGYDQNYFDGSPGYKVMNSWGTSWGNRGTAWISERFLLNYGFDFFRLTDRIGYTPQTMAHIKIYHSYWAENYDNVTVTVGVGNPDLPQWQGIVIQGLPRENFMVDIWYDLTEQQPFCPPSWNSQWWLSILDHVRDDSAILYTFDIESNGQLFSNDDVMPLYADFFPDTLWAWLPAGTSTSNMYYVNDGSVSDDQYTTQTGSDSFDGLTPSTPKRSIQEIIDHYTLKAGDQIFIDAGIYDSFSVGQHDRGSEADGYVHFMGAVSDSGQKQTIVHGSSEEACVTFSYGSFLHLNDMLLENGKYGLVTGSDFMYTKNHYWLENVEIRDTDWEAIKSTEASDLLLENSLFLPAQNPCRTLFINCSYVRMFNCTVVSDNHCALYLYSPGHNFTNNANAEIVNSIIYATGENGYCLYDTPFTTYHRFDYNNLYSRDSETIGGPELNVTNISNDPLFRDEQQSDYALKSTAGSWHSSLSEWAADEVNSPCIDQGDYEFSFENEPVPNGNRVNLGAYGGTLYGSKSAVPTRFAYFQNPAPASIEKKICSVKWNYSGSGWNPGDQISLQYSMDQLNWITISEADSLDYTLGSFDWDLAGISEGDYYLRIMHTASSEILYALNEPFFINSYTAYYVNDAFTDFDKFCSGTGSDSFDGLSPATPKATLQSVFDTYDLEPGDEILVDYGQYLVSATITPGDDDTGDETGPIIIQGASPFEGSDLIASTSFDATLLTLSQKQYYQVSNLHFQGGRQGFTMGNSSYIEISHCRFSEHSDLGLALSYCYQVKIFNNLSVRNQQVGIHLFGCNEVEIVNNTFACNMNKQMKIREYCSNITLFNNIFFADQSGECLLDIRAEAIKACDYNCYYQEQVQPFGVWGQMPQLYFADWVSASGLDEHSLFRAPLFRDIANNDYHVISSSGSWLNNSWIIDDISSPTIDQGVTHLDLNLEPVENGNRVNIGAYGATQQATKTPLTREIFLLEPYAQKVEKDDILIKWHCLGTAWGDLDRVRIEYSDNAGNSWNLISENTPALSGFYLWDASSAGSGTDYMIRIQWTEDHSIFDQNDSGFYLHNQAIYYYVNDLHANGDEFCTQVGDAANSGLSPDSPLLTVQAVIDRYRILEGDQIFVDAGEYMLNAPVLINQYDQGKEGNHFLITGAGNWDKTIFSSLVNEPLFSIQSGSSCTIQNLTMTNGSVAVLLDDSDYFSLRNCFLTGNNCAVKIGYSDRFSMQNCLVSQNTGNGLEFRDSQDFYLNLNTLSDNNGTQIYCKNSNVTSSISNSIIKSKDNGNTCMIIEGDRPQYHYNLWHCGDPNLFIKENYGYISWNDWKMSDTESTDQFMDPLFVLPLGEDGTFGTLDSDYHLQSQSGSYHQGHWTADAGNSSAIDLGKPEHVFNIEPAPNGARVNTGCYGNTAQASMSPAVRSIAILSPQGEEMIIGKYTVTWDLFGTSWHGAETLTCSYSPDNGASWIDIEDSILASDKYFLWDTSLSTPDSGPFFLIRLSCNQDVSVIAQVNQPFYLHNQPIQYYLNDLSLDNDEYCSAIGSELNNGLSPETPKLDLLNLIQTYQLASGDCVWIDDGTYTVNSNIEIGEDDQGSMATPVRFIGAQQGQTFLERSSMNPSYSKVFRIDSTKGLSFENISMKSEGMGCFVERAESISFTNCRVYQCNGFGFQLNLNQSVSIQNCLVDHCMDRGLVTYANTGLHILNSTFARNASDQIQIDRYSSQVAIENCIFSGLNAEKSCAIFDNISSFNTLDYNCYDNSSGGFITNGGSLEDWRVTSSLDAHSMHFDPLFVDPDGTDNTGGTEDDCFSLQSTQGSWQVGIWVQDSSNSPAIDRGSLAIDIKNETAPHGGRTNLGAFGNTSRASLSAKPVVFHLPELYSTHQIQVHIHWYINELLWISGQTLSVYYSESVAGPWTPVSGATNLPGISASANWNVCNIEPGSFYLRIACDQNANIVEILSEPIIIGQQYFVNDASLAGDQWCNAVGNSSNDGLTALRPLDSIQSVLDKYTLAPGSVIAVDSGEYTLTQNTVLSADDNGTSNAPVSIVGVYGKTLLNRNALSETDSAALIISGSYYSIQGLDVSGGYYGIHVTGQYNEIANCILDENVEAGIFINQGKYSDIHHNVIEQENGRAGLLAQGYWYGRFYDLPLSVENNTIVSTDAHGIELGASTGPSLFHNIIQSSGSEVFCMNVSDIQAIDEADYNNYFACDGAKTGKIYQVECSSILQWKNIWAWDRHSIAQDPLFATETSPFYPLQSTIGHWDFPTEMFISDSANSPCIDRGDPEYDDQNETKGFALNLGAYGNTPFASKAQEGRRLEIRSIGSSTILQGMVDFRWDMIGNTWQSSDSVRLEYRPDTIEIWSSVPAHLNVLCQQAIFWWDSRTLANGSYYFRLVLNQDEQIIARTSKQFQIMNEGGPEAFSLIFPEHQSTDSEESFLLQWASSTYADSYDLFLWQSMEARPALPFAESIPSISYEVTNLEYGKTYSWQVIAKNSIDQYQSDIFGFTVKGEPITAGFSADITTGEAPLTVVFTDQTAGQPIGWEWDFDSDGTVDSTLPNPSYIFTDAGLYSVSLKVQNPTNSDLLIKENHISAYPAAALEYDAVFSSTDLPDTLEPNKEYPVYFSFTNTGKTTWQAVDGLCLGAVGDFDPLCNTPRIAVSGPIRYGETAQFQTTFFSSETGTFSSDWQMIKNGAFWFGDVFTKDVIVEIKTEINLRHWSFMK